jgi:hypothetical protein
MKPHRIPIALACAALAFGSAQAAINVAPLGSASQSTDYHTDFALAPNAIDGNTDGNYYNASVTHTQSGSAYNVGNGFEWWKVTLDKTYAVDSITIWNRTDGGGDRLRDFTVSLFSGGTLEWSGIYSALNGPLPSTSFTGIDKVGDTVLVQLNRQDYLSLAEVQVFANPVPEPGSVALMLAGLGAIGMLVRRRPQNQADGRP